MCVLCVLRGDEESDGSCFHHHLKFWHDSSRFFVSQSVYKVSKNHQQQILVSYVYIKQELRRTNKKLI